MRDAETFAGIVTLAFLGGLLLLVAWLIALMAHAVLG